MPDGSPNYLEQAREKLKKSGEHLELAHLINDTLEGIFGTKRKPSEELEWELD